VRNTTDRITKFIDIETAENQFQDVIIEDFNENCPVTLNLKTEIYPGGIKKWQRETDKCNLESNVIMNITLFSIGVL
jgi:hypothetical protein